MTAGRTASARCCGRDSRKACMCPVRRRMSSPAACVVITLKRQAPSAKRQAPSAKRQAPSAKRQAPNGRGHGVVEPPRQPDARPGVLVGQGQVALQARHVRAPVHPRNASAGSAGKMPGRSPAQVVTVVSTCTDWPRAVTRKSRIGSPRHSGQVRDNRWQRRKTSPPLLPPTWPSGRSRLPPSRVRGAGCGPRTGRSSRTARSPSGRLPRGVPGIRRLASAPEAWDAASRAREAAPPYRVV
ncbi:hypothetical protein DSC45_08690 [Streptomyces sp. YIM 130001]|nr:hypothetical protein DSC45_08690 [Streptomyces sp. YIM 130001]